MNINFIRPFSFSIKKSSFGCLPIYTDYKAGGKKIVTVLRNISGDISELDKTMFRSSDLKRKINHVTKQIIFEGNQRSKIKRILLKDRY